MNKLQAKYFISNKYRSAITSGLIVMAIFSLMLVLCHIAPFGDNTFLVYDMKRQYIDFYSYYKTIVSGKNNILYSSEISLGSGAIGFYSYYLSSPFLLISLLFSNSYLPIAITVIICLKLALCAVNFNIFITNYINYDNSNVGSRLGAIIFSVSYGFCTYFVSNSINPMWLDVYMLTPILLLMLERLIFQKKCFGYIIVLSLMLIFNYYISYMVCLFLIICTVYRIYTSKIYKEQNLILILFRIGICSVWAVLMDAIILLPTYLELNNSPKDISKLGLTLSGSNISLNAILSKWYFNAYDAKQTLWGTPLIYAGVAVTFMTMLFFLNNKIEIRKKIGMATIMVIFIISFCLQKINLVWHAGMEPSGYPYRQSFLFVLTCLVCCAQNLTALEGITPLKIRIIAFIQVLYLIYVSNKNFDYINKSTVIINIILIISMELMFEIYILVKKNDKAVQILGVILCIFQLTELCLNGIFVYTTQTKTNMLSMSEYKQIYLNNNDLINEIKNLDKDFYRMESTSPREQNDAMMYDYHGITHYSSAGNLYTRNILNALGYNDDGLSVNYDINNTGVANSILGIKYIISSKNDKNIPTYYSAKLENDSRIIYENPYPLSVAMLSNHTPDKNFHIDCTPFSLQEEILSCIAGDTVGIFSSLDNLTLNKGTSDDGTSTATCEGICSIDGNVYFYIDDIGPYNQNLTVFVNNEFLSFYGNLSNYKILNLGYKNKGDKVSVTIKSDSDDMHADNIILVSEDAEKLARYWDTANERAISIEEISSSHLRLRLPSNYNDIKSEGILMTIPYDESWNVGTASYIAYDSLLFIPSDSINTIKKSDDSGYYIDLVYTPQGFKIGTVLTILSIILLLICILWSYHTTNKDYKREPK